MRFSPQAQDRLFFYGCNAAGQRIVVCFSRFKNQVAELWLCLYTADGCTYSLPCTFTLDRSDGNTFTALGLRLECLAANRRWRLAFNGTLRWGSTRTNACKVATLDGKIWVGPSGVSYAISVGDERIHSKTILLLSQVYF